MPKQLEAARIPEESVNKNGLILSKHIDKKSTEDFIQGLAQHRHFLRESDPPTIWAKQGIGTALATHLLCKEKHLTPSLFFNVSGDFL